MEEDDFDETVTLSVKEIRDYFGAGALELDNLDNALDQAQGDVATQGKAEYRILVIVRR